MTTTKPTFTEINMMLVRVEKDGKCVGMIHRLGAIPPYRYAFWPLNSICQPSCATLETCKQSIE